MSALAAASGSWGRLPYAPPSLVRRLHSRRETLPHDPLRSWLPYGNGRSYGDCCINEGNGILDCRALDRFIAWNAETGELTCEGGVRFDTILRFALPRGWFLPVTPGTQFVTLGGAIANDVHGKNHHVAGSFGEHVRSLELLRPDGVRQLSATEHPELLAATIGGLGLTGVITRATIHMQRVTGPWITQVVRRFRSIEEFFEVDASLRPSHAYTVAWVDCYAPGHQRGRGLYMAGNHANTRHSPARGTKQLAVPLAPPWSLVNPVAVRTWNQIYYRRPLPAGPQDVHFRPFFYPLDAILHWNRIYGASGFFQFQCVVPPDLAREALQQLFDRIARSGEGSFLAVLKTFGDRRSRGVLSFARVGTTLALDFPNRGARTRELLKELERTVMNAGGALYPAKDALMSADTFAASFPRWREMLPHIAPGFSSTLWRRVTEGRAPERSVHVAGNAALAT